MLTAAQTCDRMLRVRGTVQGVGFRPFVHRIATELGLRGWVRNDREGVLIRAAGDEARVLELAETIGQRHPAAARVTSVEWLTVADGAMPVTGDFAIVASARPVGEIETAAPPDLVLCADCRRELATPGDRRRGYPFITCTQCGPRYSIIESLPYDRPQTTMRRFQMCADCQREYEDPGDRRFHAEPNACPVCGPQLTLTDPAGAPLATREAALEKSAAALRAGRIVAVKGLGGFHLMCDARSEAAVAELRRRKHREEKPLAVMFRDVASVAAVAEVTPAAAALFASPPSPIVLVLRREGVELAPSVAPGNPWIGALLPSTPLHVLLLDAVDRPLVATSANLAEEPLCTDDEEARERLAGIADLFLGHDRPIARPVDDSVVRLTTGDTLILLRRARGYAPSPLTLPSYLPQPLLCVGAHMKNTVAVAAGNRVVLSPHIGDLDGVGTRRVFERTMATLGELLASKVAGVVCDKHPDYASTRHAERSGLPRVAVQHHLAHVLAVLLEHGRAADGVLGIAWDGTGYGEDGTIWGGEFILLQGGRARRFARLRPFRLPGGDAAVRDPRRVALALAETHASEMGARVARRLGLTERETSLLQAMLAQQINAPLCSSAGRLFDGVGALLELGRHNAFEGQTPLAVEIAARRARTLGDCLPFPVQASGPGADWEIDWRPAVESLLAYDAGAVPARAAAFHRGLARAMVEVAREAGVRTVALSGGCFQNALLRELTEAGLAAAGFEVLAPRELPPNDGAIAAGQALGALWNLTSVELPGLVAPTPREAVTNLQFRANPTPDPNSPCASPFLAK